MAGLLRTWNPSIGLILHTMDTPIQSESLRVPARLPPLGPPISEGMHVPRGYRRQHPPARKPGAACSPAERTSGDARSLAGWRDCGDPRPRRGADHRPPLGRGHPSPALRSRKQTEIRSAASIRQPRRAASGMTIIRTAEASGYVNFAGTGYRGGVSMPASPSRSARWVAPCNSPPPARWCVSTPPAATPPSSTVPPPHLKGRPRKPKDPAQVPEYEC